MERRRRRTSRGGSAAGARPARATRRRSRTAARALTVFALLLVATAVGAVAWLLIVYPKQPARGRGREIAVEIARGQSLAAVASTLARAGVIEDAFMWSVYARLLGADRRIRAGTTVLRDTMTPREVLQRVAVGFGSSRVRITIPEGFTRFDVAERLEARGVCDADAFLGATASSSLLRRYGIAGRTAEGYLFPDTYELRQDMPASEAVERLVANWSERVKPLLDESAVALDRLHGELRFRPHDVVTLASIVEKEAQAADEQAIIAGVFLNRLRSPGFTPKRLQADPTVSYGCREAPALALSCATFDGRHITRAMMLDEGNPYNTYRKDGLPPGPISNPGLGAIRAVLSPADHDYFYFVARGGGRHRFSHSLPEHNRAVDRFRRNAHGTPLERP